MAPEAITSGHTLLSSFFMDVWLQALQTVLSQATTAPYGTTPFWVALGSGLLALVIAGKVLPAVLCGSKADFIRTTVGILLPLVLTALAVILADLYLLPKVTDGATALGLRIAIAVLTLVGIGVYLHKVLTELSWWQSLLVVIIVTAIGYGAAFGGNAITTSLTEGGERVKEQRERQRLPG